MFGFFGGKKGSKETEKKGNESSGPNAAKVNTINAAASAAGNQSTTRAAPMGQVTDTFTKKNIQAFQVLAQQQSQGSSLGSMLLANDNIAAEKYLEGMSKFQAKNEMNYANLFGLFSFAARMHNALDDELGGFHNYAEKIGKVDLAFSSELLREELKAKGVAAKEGHTEEDMATEEELKSARVKIKPTENYCDTYIIQFYDLLNEVVKLKAGDMDGDDIETSPNMEKLMEIEKMIKHDIIDEVTEKLTPIDTHIENCNANIAKLEADKSGSSDEKIKKITSIKEDLLFFKQKLEDNIAEFHENLSSDLKKALGLGMEEEDPKPRSHSNSLGSNNT